MLTKGKCVVEPLRFFSPASLVLRAFETVREGLVDFYILLGLCSFTEMKPRISAAMRNGRQEHTAGSNKVRSSSNNEHICSSSHTPRAKPHSRNQYEHRFCIAHHCGVHVVWIRPDTKSTLLMTFLKL